MPQRSEARIRRAMDGMAASHLSHARRDRALGPRRSTRTGETVKPFTILYNLVKLPLVIVKDVAATPMDMMENCTPFEDTRRLCDKLDQLLTRKP